MIFIVKLGYYSFKFNDKNDAVIFAEIAKAHATDPDEVTVKIELLTHKELDED